MTLCVAAECRQGKRDQFVFAKDFKVESETAGAEIEAKWIPIGKAEYPALLAGTTSRAIELATLIAERLEATDAPSTENFVDIARYGVRELKNKLAGEYVGALFGIPYDKLLNDGEKILPPETRRQVMNDISRLEIGCSLLWLAFSGDDESIIIRVDEDGLVERCANFAAIGSGKTVAESVLFQRRQQLGYSVGQTVYNVYEAMRLGATAPGVGKRFTTHIATWEDAPQKVKWEYITSKYDEYLEAQFRKFGPKRTRGIQYKSSEVKLYTD